MGKILFAEESSTPATPGSGYVAVYAKTDGKLYYQDDAGTETEVGAGGGGGGIDSGTSFPASPSAGDMFYRTDLRTICFYDGTRWLGDEFPIPMAAFGSFASGMSATSWPLAAGLPGALYLERIVHAWKIPGSSTDASNYWTAHLELVSIAGIATAVNARTINTNNTKWEKAVDTVFSSNPTLATDVLLEIKAEKVGSPDNLSYMATVFVRRVFT